jgi:transcriptional regulator with XRE-family HTH domain
MSEERKLLGRRIRRFRERAGLTQPALAKSAGVSEDSLQNWEQGRSEPGALSVRLIAKAMNVPTDTLLDIDDERGAEPVPAKRGRRKADKGPAEGGQGDPTPLCE